MVNLVSKNGLTKQLLEVFSQQLGIWQSSPNLAQKFGVTRAAVSKAVQALKLEGYPFEVSSNGYRFEPDIPMLEAVQYKTKVTSTMDEIRLQARSGAPEWTTLLAEQQSNGRGRRGKPWQSANASGLYFTVLLRPSVPLAQLGLLPLLVGAVVAKSIEATTRIGTVLKWSNDVLSLDGRKICGILLETEVEDGTAKFALLGIGINVRRQEFPSQFNAAALEEYQVVHRRQLLGNILKNLQLEYKQFSRQPDHALKLWKAQSNTLGYEISVVEPNNQTWTGLATDLDSSGALMVQTENELKTVYAAEISVRHLEEKPQSSFFLVSTP
jgi:BirA family transcriptional regulator, biotin operon repressor / biotin---[acetyl-CoA-carboxylase] ligase